MCHLIRVALCAILLGFDGCPRDEHKLFLSVATALSWLLPVRCLGWYAILLWFD